MAEKEYIERGALIAEYDRVHVGAPGGARRLMVDAPAVDVVEVMRCINKKPAVDAEELACRFVSEEMRMIVSLIARGLRHVALPEEMPERIGIVIDYPQTTVRHEFVPRNDEKE